MPSRGDRQDNDKVEYEQLWPPISYNIPIAAPLFLSKTYATTSHISCQAFICSRRENSDASTAREIALPFCARGAKAMGGRNRRLGDDLAEQTKPYEPERYYMRGPGPKWREKHASRGGSAVQ
jgi:hypothetical protein